jgi:hypothetical protein
VGRARRPSLEDPLRAAFAARTAVLLVLLALGPPAAAQPVDPQKLAAAQVLFEQAQAAMDKKDYASACPKLEEVTRILPNGVGGLLTLARCYEGAGRLASAWSAYMVAQAAAAQAKRPELERQARERVGALKPKLAQLTIKVPEAIRAAPGLSITRDGVSIGAAQWDTPVPVDKGAHVVVATATGKARWEKAVDVPANGAAVTVDVAVLADAPAPAVEAPSPVTAKAGAEAPAFWTRRHIAGAAIGGAGLVGVVIGSAFGGIAISKKNQSNDGHCVMTQCDVVGAQLRSDGVTAASISTGTFIAGVVLLAGGVTLLAIPSTNQTARVGIGPGAANVSVTF